MFSFYAFSAFVQMFAEGLLLKESGMMINYILQLGKITSEQHSSDQNTLGNFKHFSPLIGKGKIKLKIYWFMKSFRKNLLSTYSVPGMELN